MIDCLLTLDLDAVRGGYYRLGTMAKTKNKHMLRPVLPSYHSTSDKNYRGRHPFNILTEEIYGD
jgi:hypothetical protein